MWPDHSKVLWLDNDGLGMPSWNEDMSNETWEAYELLFRLCGIQFSSVVKAVATEKHLYVWRHVTDEDGAVTASEYMIFGWFIIKFPKPIFVKVFEIFDIPKKRVVPLVANKLPEDLWREVTER